MRGNKVTVSHKNIIEISIIGVCFGSLIISGAVYRVIAKLVNLVLGFFG
jgi:hypothetical protein